MTGREGVSRHAREEPKPRTSPFEFHPDKILGEMYFTHDFLKVDFCFQNNFTQKVQFRTSHAFCEVRNCASPKMKLVSHFVFGEIRERNWLQGICSYKTQISSSQIRSV